MSAQMEHLRRVKNFDDLVHYLEDHLDWPLQDYDFDDLTFEYSPEELGLKDEDVAKVRRIHQLRPLQHGQPWGIFFVEFERKKLPVVVLRRILSHLVVKTRASANRANAAAWNAADLLFISAYGDEATEQREVAFAHFHQEGSDLPTLRVLGWDGADTSLKLEHVAATLQQRLRWPDDPADHNRWREQWSGAFRHRLGHVIRTANELADTLALLARNIRNAALTLLSVETERGPLRQLHKAFQTALIHDLTEANFADTYAQTITYGLLTAAISRTEMSEGRYGTVLLPDDMASLVPVTNPFLKEMLQTFLKAGGRKGGIDFDELGIQEVIALLRGDETDLPAILRDFGNKTQGEDPVIHFYEHFLAAYDKQLKIQRGVFYTPKPVVSYIVRSVHELLQSEFGLADGLADTATWGEMAQRLPDLKIPAGTSPDSPFIVILDPATGTATFLVEVIDVIYRTLTAKWRAQGMSEAQRRAAWNDYVPKHLLPRLYGYELMMAPYAIAHMKIGLKLHETGYRFGSDERVRVYLTNALEPADDVQKAFEGILPALAHEAQAVNRVKRDQRFTVVIGNPPYSGHSANKGNWIGQKLRDYYMVDGKPLGERNPKWLQDDYVKFIRLGQEFITQAGIGTFSMITNHGYLDNPTFRGMRQQLLNTFSVLYILDLHGNAKKKETTVDGSKDENVFDIQQGVGICTLVKRGRTPTQPEITHADLYGLRTQKYATLGTMNPNSLEWERLTPQPPFHLFVPIALDLLAEYEQGWKITDVFPVNTVGVVTGQDEATIAMTFQEALNLLERHQLDRDKLKHILYRPFDTRFIVYDKTVVTRSRLDVLVHMLESQNLGMIFMRQVALNDSYSHFGASRNLVDNRAFYSNKGIMSFAPLYTFQDTTKQMAGSLFANSLPLRQVNFASGFISNLERLLDLSFVATHKGDWVQQVGPEDVFQYIFAVFHSPTYRDRYSEFLKIDFPRVPFTSILDLFRKLGRLGSELVALHLVEFALDDEKSAPAVWPRYPRLSYFSGTDRVITKFPSAEKAWQAGRVAINGSSGFEGVSEAVWNFQIGGYQVCHKWLKDRKGRTLSDEDILHYAKIVTALHETIRIMGEIDAVIDEHGGWPIQ